MDNNSMSPTVTTYKNILIQSSVKPSQMALVYYEFISETPWGCKSLIEAQLDKRKFVWIQKSKFV